MARAWRWVGGAAVLAAAVGCGGSSKPPVELSVSGGGKQPPAPSAAPEKPGADAAGSPAPAAALTPRLHQSYDAAVVTDIPDGHGLPPDQTLTGKSTGKLHDEVHAMWDHVMFELPTGQTVQYTAVLDTEMGEVELSLRPDLAPNHVRNFVCLAKIGYFDGLVFEKVVHQQPEPGTPGDPVDLIETGCPLGLGDYHKGHLGYFLRPEFDPQVVHLEGTVGAWHGEGDATACSRFYVTLGKAPALDGRYTVFGQVTRGMDVVRKIHTQPVVTGGDGQTDRPAKPVVVKKVTITSREVAKAAN